MLTSFADNIWLADGGTLSVIGFRYPTRCAIIRLADGTLVVWSPVTLTDTLKTAVDRLGPIGHLIAPNTLHHLFLPDWQAAYPDAQLHAPKAVRAKRPDLTITAELTDTAPPDWAGQIDQVVVRGNRITTETVFFHKDSGTVIFTDILQQFPNGWHTGWRGLIARLDLMVGPEPQVPRKFRLAFTDRRAARERIARILDWPAQNVLMAHGSPVTTDARACLARSFRWLTG